MAHHADDHDGDKPQEGHQKQRRGEGITVLRRCREQEHCRVNGWCSDIHHHHKQSTRQEKCNQHPFQSLHGHLLMEVMHWSSSLSCIESTASCLFYATTYRSVWSLCSSRSSSRSTRRSTSSSMRP